MVSSFVLWQGSASLIIARATFGSWLGIALWIFRDVFFAAEIHPHILLTLRACRRDDHNQLLIAGLCGSRMRNSLPGRSRDEYHSRQLVFHSFVCGGTTFVFCSIRSATVMTKFKFA